MNTTQTTALEPGYRVQLPPEWAEELRLQGEVVLAKTEEGILVKARPKYTWDDVFATRLTARSGDPATPTEITEVSGDDIL